MPQPQQKPDWLDRINKAVDANKINDGMTVELLLEFAATLPPAGKEGLARFMERECPKHALRKGDE